MRLRLKSDRPEDEAGQGGYGAFLARAAVAVGVLGLVLLPVILTIPNLQGDLASGKAGADVTTSPSPSPSPSAAPSPTAPPPSPVPPPPPLPPPPPVVVTPSLYPKVGSRGPDILALEQRLEALSYMAGKVDGVFDRATAHGLTAFQKVEGLERTGVGDAVTLIRLQTATRPAPTYASPPDHLEVDIKRQVVFVVRGTSVTATLPTSTGTGKKFTSQGYTRRAVTPNGTYAVSYKRQGWRRSPLGLLYRPAYFNGGIAFHGAPSVPARPASHGCVRLPMAFADWFAENASPVGMPVLVYGGPQGENPAPVLTDAPAAPGAPVGPVEPGTGPNPAPSPSPSPEGLLPGLLNP